MRYLLALCPDQPGDTAELLLSTSADLGDGEWTPVPCWNGCPHPATHPLVTISGGNAIAYLDAMRRRENAAQRSGGSTADAPRSAVSGDPVANGGHPDADARPHGPACKCPPCYYSDDEPFTGTLSGTPDLQRSVDEARRPGGEPPLNARAGSGGPSARMSRSPRISNVAGGAGGPDAV